MLFPTIDFAVFFAVVFLLSWLFTPFPRRWKLFMILASYVFYAWWDWHFVFLLAASTAVAQLGALAIRPTGSPSLRKAALWATVAVELGLLGWFKYYGFFATNVANVLHGMGIGAPLPLLQVTLPVGISFFTFMALSYVIDVYRRELEPASWLDFATYLSFFPHLVAGPIVRGSELLPQIRRRRDPRKVDFSRAAYLILGGLFKKVVLSSFLATAIVDPVFNSPGQHSSVEILVAIYGYAVQIYADFSGYTDIAIGVALLLGFTFPDNFDSPYTARTLQDFWRRWHMTLSRWLRDYLYIPLGGNRGGRWSTYRNIMITMVLGGLWHGAAWTFVMWGTIHGVGQVTGHWRRSRREARGLEPLPDRRWDRIAQRIVTFNVVCLAWVFFRSDSFSTALTLLRRLVTAWGPAPAVTPLVLLAIAVGISAQFVPHGTVDRVRVAFSRLRPAGQGTLLAITLFGITTLGPQGVAPFIYYRF